VLSQNQEYFNHHLITVITAVNQSTPYISLLLHKNTCHRKGSLEFFVIVVIIFAAHNMLSNIEEKNIFFLFQDV